MTDFNDDTGQHRVDNPLVQFGLSFFGFAISAPLDGIVHELSHRLFTVDPGKIYLDKGLFGIIGEFAYHISPNTIELVQNYRLYSGSAAFCEYQSNLVTDLTPMILLPITGGVIKNLADQVNSNAIKYTLKGVALMLMIDPFVSNIFVKYFQNSDFYHVVEKVADVHFLPYLLLLTGASIGLYLAGDYIGKKTIGGLNTIKNNLIE